MPDLRGGEEMTGSVVLPNLKPCPFCGERRIFFNPPDPTINFKGSINCPACGVEMPREVNDDQELIDCWNTRVEVGG